MKKKVTKKIRMDIESMGVNIPFKEKRKLYQRFKKIHKSIKRGQ